MGFLSASILSNLSRLFYRGVEATDSFLGLPKKMSRTLEYRKNWRRFLSPQIPSVDRLWIHGSSLGELEDLASFFLDENRLRDAGFDFASTIVTASSVSTKESMNHWRKNFPFAYVGPVPPEKSKEIEEFYKRLCPTILLLSHSDFWPSLMGRSELKKGICWYPQKSTSAKVFQKNFLQQRVREIALRDPQMKFPLELPTSDVGNLRVERILQRIDSSKNQPHPLIDFDATPDPDKLSVLVASCRVEDARCWARFLETPLAQKIAPVFIPHEVHDPVEIGRIKAALSQQKVIAVEGILLEAYRGFDLAFVGGGFGGHGLHNILEPALHSLPIVTGPSHINQPDAPMLQKAGQLIKLQRFEDLSDFLESCLVPEKLARLKKSAQESADLLKKDADSSRRMAALISKIKSH